MNPDCPNGGELTVTLNQQWMSNDTWEKEYMPTSSALARWVTTTKTVDPDYHAYDAAATIQALKARVKELEREIEELLGLDDDFVVDLGTK